MPEGAVSISITKLKRATELQFHGSGGDFDFTFYSAVNDVIQDLIAKTVIPDLEAIDEDDPPATIDIDEAYYPAFRDGVPYYMQKSAIWARSQQQVTEADYLGSLAYVQERAINNEDPATGLNYEEEE